MLQRHSPLVTCTFTLTFILSFFSYFLPYNTSSGGFGEKFIDDRQIKENLSSVAYFVCLCTGISMSMPPFFDIVVDFMFNPFKSFSLIRPAFNVIFLLLSLLVPDLILLVYVIPYRDTRFFFVIYSCRIALLIYGLHLYLIRFGGELFKSRISTIGTSLLLIGIVFPTVAPCFTLNVGYAINCSGVGIQYLAVVLLAITLYQWTTTIYFQLKKGEPLASDQYYCSIYAAFAIFVMFGLGVLWLACGRPCWTQYSVDYLVGHNALLILFYVSGAIFYGRLMRNEALIKQATEVKQMYVRYMSHEMRTPLSTVLMGLTYIETELNKLGINQDILEGIEETKSNCGITLNILNEMLMYDKIESGMLKLNHTDVYCYNILERTVSSFSLQARQEGIELAIECPDDNKTAVEHAMIHADENKLAQVFRNVISNALKFTPDHGKVTVNVRMEKRTGKSVNVMEFIRIDVVDTGPGISVENQRKLFREIIQFNPEKLQSGGGSGLGLYISKKIMDLHNGELSVYSKGEGFGATFSVLLPVHAIATTCYSEGLSVSRGRDINEYHSIRRRRKSSLRRNSALKIIPFDFEATVGNVLMNNSDHGDHSYHRENLGRDNSHVSGIVERLGNFEREGDGGGGELTFRQLSLVEEVCSMSSEGVGGVERTTRIGSDANNVTSNHSLHETHGAEVTDEIKVEDTIDGKGISSASIVFLPRILIVDDAPLIRKMMYRLLVNRSSSITQAQDGIEALNIIRGSVLVEDEFDIILIDNIMPKMNGPTAVKQIRELGFTGLIIGVTGNALPVDVQTFINHGANHVLAKPFDLYAYDNIITPFLKSRING